MKWWKVKALDKILPVTVVLKWSVCLWGRRGSTGEVLIHKSTFLVWFFKSWCQILVSLSSFSLKDSFKLNYIPSLMDLQTSGHDKKTQHRLKTTIKQDITRLSESIKLHAVCWSWTSRWTQLNSSFTTSFCSTNKPTESEMLWSLCGWTWCGFTSLTLDSRFV